MYARYVLSGHRLSHLDGYISWRHPEDAIKQRERLKQERNARCEQMSEPVARHPSTSLPTPLPLGVGLSEFEEQVEVVPTQKEQTENEQEFEEQQNIGFTMSM